LPPVIDWVALVGLVLLLAFLVPGLSVLRLFHLDIERHEVGLILVYSLGIALVVMPLSLYWTNFFGIEINILSVLTVSLLVVGVSGAVQIVITLRKKTRL
jgi:hypothetical protein